MKKNVFLIFLCAIALQCAVARDVLVYNLHDALSISDDNSKLYTKSVIFNVFEKGNGKKIEFCIEKSKTETNSSGYSFLIYVTSLFPWEFSETKDVAKNILDLEELVVFVDNNRKTLKDIGNMLPNPVLLNPHYTGVHFIIEEPGYGSMTNSFFCLYFLDETILKEIIKAEGFKIQLRDETYTVSGEGLGFIRRFYKEVKDW